MGLFVVFFVTSLFLATLYFQLGEPGLRRERVWRDAAGRLGLEPLPGGTRPAMRGQLRGFEVSAERMDDPHRASTGGFMLFRVTSQAFPASEVVDLVRERIGLDRQSLGVIHPFKAVDGGLQQAVSGETLDVETLSDHLERVVAVAQQVASEPMHEHLAANVAGDGPVEMRRRSLQALVDHFPTAEVTARALDACLRDADPELRCLAALETSRSAIETFATDDRLPSRLRLRTLEYLEVMLPREQLSPLLGRILELTGDEPQLRALSLVRVRREEVHQPKVVALASRTRSPRVALAAAETLVALGARDEWAMVALVRGPSEKARALAIRELGEWGGLRAVEALLGAGEVGKAAARGIQRRLAGVTGAVSLAEVESSGGVSLPAGDLEKS